MGLRNESLTGPGLVTAMPIYGENLKGHLQNQKADDLESWYVALTGLKVAFEEKCRNSFKKKVGKKVGI